MRPQGIDHLGPLPHQQIAGSMLASTDLLPGRFDPYKTHGGATDRLTDRLGVSSIILVTPDMSLHILRRHQTYLMAKLGQFVCPIMRCGAGFHAYRRFAYFVDKILKGAKPAELRSSNRQNSTLSSTLRRQDRPALKLLLQFSRSPTR